MQKVALVTGAAAGIGRACSVRLAKEGHAVGVLDLDEARCADTVQEITAAGGKAIVKLRRALGPVTDYVLGTFVWHMDGVTLDIPPPKATMLSARALSAEGGATEFANLSPRTRNYPRMNEKREIEGLRAIHTIEASARPVFGHPPQERIDRWRRMAAPMEHPLVWKHESGRQSLLLGSHADGLVGWPGPHGRAVLWRLQQWAAQPDFVYRHKWQVGDLLIWNNPGMMHRVVPYTDTRRVMHRTVIAGKEKPGRIAPAESMTKMLEHIG